MKDYIEITTGKTRISVVADRIGDKKKEQRIIKTLEKTVEALKTEEANKERYGNEIVINIKK